MFWPLPAKLKPETENTEVTFCFSSTRKCCSTFFITSSVLSCVDPAGSITSENTTP